MILRISRISQWACGKAARRMLWFTASVLLLPVAMAQGQARLGTNLTGVEDYYSNVPFLDAFKQSRGWYTQRDGSFDTNEAARLQLDDSGWLRTLTPTAGAAVQYTRVCTLVFSMAAVDAGPQAGKLPYPAGEWEVRYDGVGQLSYSLAARLNSSGVIAPGVDPLLVTPAEPGIQICITQTDAANPVRNIRLYPLGVKSRVLAGEVFSPDFLARLQIYSALRFMDWQRTNNSTQGEFANRALSADARYTTERGVPVEVMVDLANNLQIQPWFNMPQPATDAYVSAFAALVRDRLAPTLPVYVEYSNEIWNDQFTQGRTIGEEGVASFQGLPGSDFDKRLNRFGERTAQICQLWRAAFGAQADRVRCVMAGQAANTYIAQTALECPLSALKPCRDKGIHGLAIAPYVGDHIGLPQLEAAVSAWTGEADGGLSRMFNELNTGTELRHEGLSGMPVVRERISAHAALARSQAVALLAYEGGQHLVGVGEPANNASINTLMDAANRDARMGSLYTSYLQEWASAGGDLFMHFSDVGNFSRFGRWGALEIVTQTSSPKFDALKAFAQNGTGTVLGNQTISFGAAPTLVVGATATVSATGGASGSPVIFTSTTSGVCSVSGSNGATITGVTAGTCTIAANQAGNANFNAAPQVTQNITVSAPATRLINLSTRGQVLSGDNVMIGGFIIQGSASKTVLIRAVGPTLANFGVRGVLSDPTLQLFSGQTQIASNDNWQTASNAAAIQATTLAPSNTKESAILTTLAPGAYTAVVSGVGGATGVGIVEVYDIDHPEVPLINISTRGQVQTGDNVMIGGFIIQGTSPQTVLIRAVGPNLANFGVSGVLSDPKLELYSGQNIIASNDNWQTATNAAAIQATTLAPVDPREAAILITLQPGAYTAVVSGANGGVGVGIIEVFAR